MKKIIAAIDGLKYSESTVQHAVFVARQCHAHLVGVFLEDFTYHSYKIYEMAESEGQIPLKLRLFEEKDKETRKNSVAAFEKTCQEAGINYSVHHDRNIALQDILHESIYADLVIVNSGETLTHYEEAPPTRFLRDLLAEAKCPVLVVPKQYEPINHIQLLYDGSPAAVYAARTFSYVLVQLKYLDTEVLSVKSPKDDLHIQDGKLFREFMKRHYPGAAYSVVHGMAENQIIDHIKANGKNPLVVLGAYQRGMLSRWLKPSMADILIQELQVPLFIAHS